MPEPIDLLQIKIEKAKMQLPEETQNAINAVDWKTVVLGIRETKGYSFEQLADLETETELVLCGLLSPEDYPGELEKRMRLSKMEVNDLVKEMNERVFAKIKENLIKNIERKKVFTKKIVPEETVEIKKETKNDAPARTPTGTEIVPEKLELTESEKPVTETHPILAQKLSGPFQVPVVKTEHSLENITRTNNQTETPVSPASSTPKPAPAAYPPKEDPYRLPPE